ncbi:MAG: peptidoglycan editing factor PgeF [Pseudomonadota bacterium]
MISTELNPVQAEPLSACEGIHHAFFTRHGGVSSGIFAGLNAGLGSNDDKAAVEENRRQMAAHLGVETTGITGPYQVHSADVVRVDANWPTQRPKADAVVTSIPGQAIGIVTADCGPVLFADPKAGVIGAAHAGWQGALKGVLENTVAAMEAEGAQRGDIIAVLGPMISQDSYEVGPDFPAPFLEQSPDNQRFFKPSQKPSHHMFDLAGYIVTRLTQAGVAASQTGHCTYRREEEFYSYRRTTHRKEPDYGRQLSAIVLKP